jgi:putative inorganic carbon (hco3(-)) transporter
MTSPTPFPSFGGQETGAAATPYRRPVPLRKSERKTPASYWLLILFLLLLYANTPKVLPALEVFRPAAVVGGCALMALAGETLLGGRRFAFGWPVGGLLIVFCFAAALSCLSALWPRYAVDSLSDLVKMTLVFFFLVNSAETEGRLRGVMWAMVIGGLCPALGTLYHYRAGILYEGRAAWVGIFANPNEVAYSLVILLPLVAYLAVSHGWFARLVLAGISALYLGAIFVTFSRGGMVGLLVVMAVYAWRKRNIWLRGALVIAVTAGFSVAASHWTRAEDFSQLNNDLSFQQRIATSEVGLQMFVDHPWTGVGLGCGVVAWPLYAPQGLYTTGALITHNTVIQVMGETGILGGIPFLFMIGIAIFQSRRLALSSGRPDLGIAIETALWGLVACGMSGGYVLTWFPYLLLGLAGSAWNLARRESEVKA